MTPPDGNGRLRAADSQLVVILVSSSGAGRSYRSRRSLGERFPDLQVLMGTWESLGCGYSTRIA